MNPRERGELAAGRPTGVAGQVTQASAGAHDPGRGTPRLSDRPPRRHPQAQRPGDGTITAASAVSATSAVIWPTSPLHQWLLRTRDSPDPGQVPAPCGAPVAAAYGSSDPLAARSA